MLIVVNFHYIRPSFEAPHPGIVGVTPAQFAAQLERMAAAGEFVSLADVLRAVRNGDALPPRAWLITFDDGLREQFEHAWRWLVRRGVPAAFFVNTAPLASGTPEPVHVLHALRAQIAPDRVAAALAAAAADEAICWPPAVAAPYDTPYRFDGAAAAALKYAFNYALTREQQERLLRRCAATLLPPHVREQLESLYFSRDQLCELAAHGCIGAHAHQHVPLGRLAAPAQLEQLVTARRLLEAWTTQPIAAVSYPYGSAEACPAELCEIAADAGYALGFTMEPAANVVLEPALLLARCSNSDFAGAGRPGIDPREAFDVLPAASRFTGAKHGLPAVAGRRGGR
ncbi:MAG: polysaccharide deacetylase family protein [Phycisphaerae bacterium]